MDPPPPRPLRPKRKRQFIEGPYTIWCNFDDTPRRYCIVATHADAHAKVAALHGELDAYINAGGRLGNDDTRVVYYYSDERGQVYNSYMVDGKLTAEQAIYTDNYYDKTYTPIKRKIGRNMSVRKARYAREVPWAEYSDSSMAARAHEDGVDTSVPFWRNILALGEETLKHLKDIYKCEDYSEPPTEEQLRILDALLLQERAPKGAPGG